jgi:hypothetical protein
MQYHVDESCTYRPGEETCFRTDCQYVCVRNFRDQSDSDIPLTVQAKQNGQHHPSLWQSLFGRRTAQSTH